MSLSSRITIAVAVLFATAGSLAAQGSGENAVAGDPTAPAVTTAAPAPSPSNESKPISLAPFAQDASVGVRQHESNGRSPVALPKPARTSNSVALMIVGGAMLVAGAIIGDTGGTLIMVGGVVVGAIGLYRYLQ